MVNSYLKKLSNTCTQKTKNNEKRFLIDIGLQG